MGTACYACNCALEADVLLSHSASAALNSYGELKFGVFTKSYLEITNVRGITLSIICGRFLNRAEMRVYLIIS